LSKSILPLSESFISSLGQYQTKPSSLAILNQVSNLEGQPFSNPASLWLCGLSANTLLV